VGPEIRPEILGLNRAWNWEQTKPAQKHVSGCLGLFWSNFRLKPEIFGLVSGQNPGQTELRTAENIITKNAITSTSGL
jgi:hypothetical protein